MHLDKILYKCLYISNIILIFASRKQNNNNLKPRQDNWLKMVKDYDNNRNNNSESVRWSPLRSNDRCKAHGSSRKRSAFQYRL